MKNQPFPVLKGFGDSHTIRVWCIYCKRLHVHGIGGFHRVAHCESGPLRETGYIPMRFTARELAQMGVKQ